MEIIDCEYSACHTVVGNYNELTESFYEVKTQKMQRDEDYRSLFDGPSRGFVSEVITLKETDDNLKKRQPDCFEEYSNVTKLIHDPAQKFRRNIGIKGKTKETVSPYWSS